MNLKNYKLLEENADHFHIQHADGSSFRVAKAGLAESLHKKIAAHFAEGGEVSPMFQGDDAQLMNSLTQVPQVGGVDPQAESARLRDQYRASLGSPYMGGMPGAVQAPPPGQDAAPEAPRIVSPGMLAQIKATRSTDAPSSAPPVAPGASPAPVGSGVPSLGTDKAITDAQRVREAALMGQGDLEQQRLASEQKIREEQQPKMEALAKQHDALLDLNNRNQNAAFEAVKNGEIQPNRLWQSRTTGQKVSAAIGMILGGIGSGLTHGPNYAVDIINKEIDRDVDAQKDNLGKQQNLLSYYMRQGHDLQEAKTLAIAHKKEEFAGQLLNNATKYAGPEAQAKAMEVVGQLREQTAVLRQQAQGVTLKNQMEGLQLQAMKKAMANPAPAAGKPVPEQEMTKIVNQVEALKAIDSLEQAHADASGAAGTAGWIVPGNTAANRYSDSMNNLAGAVAAGALPAARETPGLMEEFKKGFPGALTSHDRAKESFGKLREAVRSNAASQIAALESAGVYSPNQIAEIKKKLGLAATRITVDKGG